MLCFCEDHYSQLANFGSAIAAVIPHLSGEALVSHLGIVASEKFPLTLHVKVIFNISMKLSYVLITRAATSTNVKILQITQLINAVITVHMCFRALLKGLNVWLDVKNFSLTQALHSFWVHDPHHHHRQLYRLGSGAAPSRRGQNTHVEETGEIFIFYSNVLCLTQVDPLASCFAGEDGALLHRHVLLWGWYKDHCSGLCVPQRFLPQERMERHGLHCGP